MHDVTITTEELKTLADKISLPLDEDTEAVRKNVETWFQKANPFLLKMMDHQYDDIYPMSLITMD